jgi:hypothetical protein
MLQVTYTCLMGFVTQPRLARRRRLLLACGAVLISAAPAWAQQPTVAVFGQAGGASIGHARRLTSLFPSGSGTNFSLLIYQDVAKAVPGLLKGTLLPKMPAEGKELMPDLSFMERYRAPGIAYANAGPRAIDLFLNTPTGIDFNMGMAVPLVANWLAPHLNVGLTADKYAEAVVELQKMGALAEKYKAANGRYPKSLGELKSAGTLPVDPFAVTPGDTLRMTPDETGKGLILYSVGPDGLDQRGQTVLEMDQELDSPGDIVLRVPEDLK